MTVSWGIMIDWCWIPAHLASSHPAPFHPNHPPLRHDEEDGRGDEADDHVRLHGQGRHVLLPVPQVLLQPLQLLFVGLLLAAPVGRL